MLDQFLTECLTEAFQRHIAKSREVATLEEGILQLEQAARLKVALDDLEGACHGHA